MLLFTMKNGEFQFMMTSVLSGALAELTRPTFLSKRHMFRFQDCRIGVESREEDNDEANDETRKLEETTDLG
ncbi:hypothetical protein CRYUN_Cryun34aG0097000 [Craigia yunnanensis]